MTKYFDASKECLVFVGQKANEAFWDTRWQIDDFRKEIERSLKRNQYFVRYTQKYLPAGATVLEGGCGRGDIVYALQKSGFQAHGVDFAPETVAKINTYAPELKVTQGDVRSLNFPDNYFDGYWSLGVIEHFYDGYEPILQEMNRVIKKDGYLFLTFPAMSRLRKQKARANQYPSLKENEQLLANFYQFALDPDRVIVQFQNKGYRLMEIQLRNGFIGLQEEIGWRPLQWLLNKLDKQNWLAKKLRKAIDLLSTPFSNHGVMLIFKKQA